ncbi:hypothetical protein GGX14DRAFT_184600 [Mycena pura]|uniref:DUF6699 domain-containing protein n=1 Tax=Mycena pura TaxID=153505 RepID=A0AAD6V0W8_9AGAR|nr:hypothetical protein GGX14DRAFT_184600 [Mycena pura]
MSFVPKRKEASQDSSGDCESNSSHSDSDSSSSLQILELSPDLGSAQPLCIPPQRPHPKPLRPALKQSTSWNSTSTRTSTHELHVSFVIPTRSEPDCTLLAMHPLFAYTHLDHAPISCDIAYAPSARTILDRATREPIPASVLDEPATEPPLYTQLILRSSLFPWDVVVRPHAAAAPAPASPRSRCPRRRRKITNLDVLYALQDTLSARVTQDEWAGLGARARRRISHAYETRCIARGGGWDAGVRRIDWLEGRTRLVGIELLPPQKDCAVAPATLVFKKPA